MSGTENEAVRAALDALAQWTEPQYGDLHAISAARAVHIAYDAMRPIIAREVITGVCRQEGHQRLNTTSLNSVELEFRCGRCGEIWNEPRPDTSGIPVHLGRGADPITVSIDGINKHPGWIEVTAEGGLRDWRIEMCAATGEQHRGQRIPIEFWSSGTGYRGEAIVASWHADSAGKARTVMVGAFDYIKTIIEEPK